MFDFSNSELYLGFDFGYKRIGVAVGNALTGRARPLKTLKAEEGIPSWPLVDSLIQSWNPKALIVGLPSHIDGTEQYTTHAAKHFAQTLTACFKRPVYLSDERLSTVEARAQLFEAGGYQKIKQAEVDSFAACIILEQWLQHQS